MSQGRFNARCIVSRVACEMRFFGRVGIIGIAIMLIGGTMMIFYDNFASPWNAFLVIGGILSFFYGWMLLIRDACRVESVSDEGKDSLDMSAIEALHALQPEKEIARLGPERYVQLGFHNDLSKDWDARLNFQFWNFAWPYMPSLALVPKTKPPNLDWDSDLFSLIEIGLKPAWARRKG